MQITKIHFQGIKTDSPHTTKEKKSCKGIDYAISGALPAALGLTHGIYKKLEKTTNPQDPQRLVLPVRDGDIIRNAVMLKSNGSENAISIISAYPNHRRLNIASKVLLDDFVDIKKFPPTSVAADFIEVLKKLGYNPNHSLMSFIEKHNIEKLNEELKTVSNIDFHLEFEPGKGRGRTSYRLVEVLEKEKEGTLTSLTQSSEEIKTFFFKKILNPYDEKFLCNIEKLPFGEKFANFMRKTETPINRITFKPLRHLFYDTTSMAKGGGVAAIGGIALYSGAKALHKAIFNKPANSSTLPPTI